MFRFSSNETWGCDTIIKIQSVLDKIVDHHWVDNSIIFQTFAHIFIAQYIKLHINIYRPCLLYHTPFTIFNKLSFCPVFISIKHDLTVINFPKCKVFWWIANWNILLILPTNELYNIHHVLYIIPYTSYTIHNTPKKGYLVYWDATQCISNIFD